MSLQQEKEEVEEENKKIKKRAKKILEFLTNSRYVIFVINAFTFCWLPWLLTGLGDILYHEVGIKLQQVHDGRKASKYHIS